jgi:hypothetical protein
MIVGAALSSLPGEMVRERGLPGSWMMPGQWSSLFSRSFHEKMALMLWNFVSDF